MSLVICSNNFKDGTIARQQNSIENAFSFRNAFSSTYKIPANSQVALQSAKLNIDGKVVYSRNNNPFYQYFGKKLDLDGETDPQIEDTTSHPLLVQLSDINQIEEKSPTDFANNLQARLNDTIYHPNLKNQISVETLKNASAGDFLGYKITYDQVNTVTNNVPSNAFKQWYRKDGDYANATSDFFSYSAGVFQRNASLDQYDVCAGINTQFPLNLGAGDLQVNISSANANVNASGTQVEFAVGLSRFVNNENWDGYINPTYFTADANDDLGYLTELPFIDFGVGINHGGEIVCFHTVWDENAEALRIEEVEYWENASSSFSGNGARKDSAEGKYTKFNFFAEGERMKAQIFNASGAKWETITTYRAGADKDSMFTPINQAQWCLHPVFVIGSNASNGSGKLEFDEYNGVDITGYDPTKVNKGGWFETMELNGKDDWCESVEKRVFNQTADSTAYVQSTTNASGGVNLDHVLILQKSDIYTPSDGANARDLLGFNRDIVDTPTYTPVGSQVIFESEKVPSLINNMSLFVRLNNLGQSVLNAYTGFQSKIISHLVNLETAVGIVSYEPSNLIWLDLNNPAELNITDLDLSVNYINEQYATIVSGDSIICLYFRSKDDKM
jgi:hypothetical protein